MLTVLKNNTAALQFYARMGYAVDASSPSRCDEDAPYEILSKAVTRGAAAPRGAPPAAVVPEGMD